MILSGHRTTYGAEFHRIDELHKGDGIHIETPWGPFNYSVTTQEIVEPDSRAIVVPSQRAELVLTTCTPKYSAAQRLIVYAELEPACSTRWVRRAAELLLWAAVALATAAILVAASERLLPSNF